SEVDGFVKDVLEREKLGVTGIGNFVAIPHGQSDYVNETTIAIGKLNKEIEWESLDNNGVRIVILFVVKNDKNFADEHLKLLSKVASNLANEDILKKLLNADSKEEIKNCFRS
ncbi:MAG: PTS sugar transporter subunit IIA, partial [Anaerococcus obesiensis]